MFLCVNANASVDRTEVIPGFRLNAIHRPGFSLALPGGKGCNFARAIKTIGGQATVTGWVGGYSGKFIEAGLHQEGIATDLINTGAESRTCVSILDPDGGTLTELYEQGAPLARADIGAFERKFAEIVSGFDLVALCGSLPREAPVDLYARLVAMSREAGIPVFLDTSGPPLKAAIETAGVTLVKPNRTELAELAGVQFDDDDELYQAALDLSISKSCIVVLTLGKQGALACRGGRMCKAIAPRVNAVSAVGSGDAALAALALAYFRGDSLDVALQSGVAAGAANTLMLGAGCFDKDDYLELLDQVSIEWVV